MSSPALRPLLEHAIDYAGTFPPAALDLHTAKLNYECYLKSEHSWMLGRFVVRLEDVDLLPASWRLSVLADRSAYKCLDESRHGGDESPRHSSTIETKTVFRGAMPTYCEVPIHELDAVKSIGAYAKIRTGGVTPGAVPSVAQVAEFIRACAERRLAFKATAGLHHALPSVRPFTHGFINVLFAAAMAWSGDADIEPILEEEDPAAFTLRESACWRDHSLTAAQIADARKNFIHSFGSCSFEEPVAELQQLRWL